jgi:hypothetical protein
MKELLLHKVKTNLLKPKELSKAAGAAGDNNSTQSSARSHGTPSTKSTASFHSPKRRKRMPSYTDPVGYITIRLLV